MFDQNGEVGLTLGFTSIDPTKTTHVRWSFSVSGPPAISDIFAAVDGSGFNGGTVNLSENVTSNGSQVTMTAPDGSTVTSINLTGTGSLAAT